MSTAELFLETCTILELTAPIKTLVVALRRQHRLKLPDAIIAATAQWLDIPLLTDDEGFKKVSGLDMILLKPD